MTAVLVILHTALSLAAGAAVTGLVGIPLRARERLLVAVVTAVVLPSMATYVIAVGLGLTVVTVFAGPVAIIAGAWVFVLAGASSPLPVWRTTAAVVRHRVQTAPPWGFMAFGAVMFVALGAIFARTLVYTTGSSGPALEAGYSGVWADWSQHLTTASSFAVGANLPPVNPLFSGTTLLYPFLPDFHSAELMVLGVNAGAALAWPAPVLITTFALLSVCFAARIGIPAPAGGFAAVAAVIGGSLGFVRVISDACLASVAHLDPAAVFDTASPQYAASAAAFTDPAAAAAHGCSLHQVAAHPGLWPGIITSLWKVIGAQPRAYDGLTTGYTELPVHNLQWYTPLGAWWVPQRSFVYGIGIVLAVVLLLAVAVQHTERAHLTWGIAAVMAGLLPLFHVHSLFALTLILIPVIAVYARREWLLFVAILAIVAGPRLLQLSTGPKGSAAEGNQYPWLALGWMYHFDPAKPAQGYETVVFSAGGLLSASVEALALPFRADWWAFWIANTGVAAPATLAGLVLAAGRLSGVGNAHIRRVCAVMPRPFIPWVIGGVLIFGAANVVVFQTWAWDDTKLLAYWFYIAMLVVGTLAGAVWHRRVLRATALVLLASVMATGTLVLLRTTPLEAQASRTVVNGPFILDNSGDITVADEVAAHTPTRAVFVSSARPQDPILTLAGRIGTAGYAGWLSSYGIPSSGRFADVETIVHGCGTESIGGACAVRELLHRYDVSFVEIDVRGDTNGIHDADAAWWARQKLPVVAQSAEITVYDVRGI